MTIMKSRVRCLPRIASTWHCPRSHITLQDVICSRSLRQSRRSSLWTCLCLTFLAAQARPLSVRSTLGSVYGLKNPLLVGVRSGFTGLRRNAVFGGVRNAGAHEGSTALGGSSAAFATRTWPLLSRRKRSSGLLCNTVFEGDLNVKDQFVPTSNYLTLSVLTKSGPVVIASGQYDHRQTLGSGEVMKAGTCHDATLHHRGGGTISTPSAGVSTKTPSAVCVSSGGGARQLVFWENMVCGAISRTVAQTIMHPANTMKTMMQAARTNSGGGGAAEAALSFSSLSRPSNLKILTRGAGAQFLMSVPHGAVNFAVLEYVRRQMSKVVQVYQEKSDAEQLASGEKRRKRKRDTFMAGPGLDFVSSAISTICCSVVSTPQMMITDNIMAGTYPNLPKAVSGIIKKDGAMGFYTGWWPGLAGKIPSYALTWTFFQQLKNLQLLIMKRPPKDIENTIMGCVSSAVTVTLMIPMDTIKTRLVTQGQYAKLKPYKGIADCAVRIAREEGIKTFYRGLAPRLLSVVPMIGIQFGVYEYMKKVMIQRSLTMGTGTDARRDKVFDEVAMEVAADDEQPFPAPYFSADYNEVSDDGSLKVRLDETVIEKWMKQLLDVIGVADHKTSDNSK